MEWEPRFQLTAAEKHVDFPAHNNHIVLRRAAVEKNARPATRRLAVAIGEYGLPTNGGTRVVAERLEHALQATARFGFDQARREIRMLRTDGRLIAYSVPDVGAFNEQARRGLAGVLALVQRRALETAYSIAAAAIAARGDQPDPILKASAATAAALRVLHNHVLELVGETLNMGRTAGALSLAQPPTFAMRSEQLDNNTCDGCSYEQGGIYQLDSDEYYAHMPPSYCYGLGRCRGIMVFGDATAQLALPEAA
jgi:hypothetical protein